MKKYFLMLLSFMFVATMSVGFVSCGDDDEDDSNPLVGTWTRKDSWSNQYGSGYWEDSYVFKSDNTGAKVYKENSTEEVTEEKNEFRYKITAYEPNSKIGFVEIIWNSDGRVYTPEFSIQGNTLVIGNEVRTSYTKQ